MAIVIVRIEWVNSIHNNCFSILQSAAMFLFCFCFCFSLMYGSQSGPTPPNLLWAWQIFIPLCIYLNYWFVYSSKTHNLFEMSRRSTRIQVKVEPSLDSSKDVENEKPARKRKRVTVKVESDSNHSESEAELPVNSKEITVKNSPSESELVIRVLTQTSTLYDSFFWNIRVP